jgi:tetratricopeptide (TPR) repeat protein
MNRCVLLYLMLVSIWPMSSAQDLRIDSLKSLIPEARGSFAELDEIYTELAFSFHAKHNTASCFTYLDRIVKEAPDSSFICKAWRNKTRILFELERFEEGKALGQKVLMLSRRRGYVRNEYVVLNILGVYSIHWADYSYALKCLYSSAMIREKNNESAQLVYGNIGLVLYKLRETKKALTYFERSMSDSSNPSDNSVTLINIALCHFHLKDFASGERHLRMARPLVTSDEGLANWSFSYGLGYLLNNDFERAKVWFNKSLELARNVNDPRFEAESLVHLSSAFQGLGKYDLSLAVLHSAWEVVKRHGYNEIAMDVLRQFRSTYRSLGNHRMVTQYNAEYLLMRERVHPLRLAMEKAKIETTYYEVALRESQIKNEQMLAMNDDLIWRQKVLNIMTALCSILMLIIAIVFLKSIRVQRGFADQLNRKVKERIEVLEGNKECLINRTVRGCQIIAFAQGLLFYKHRLEWRKDTYWKSFAETKGNT